MGCSNSKNVNMAVKPYSSKQEITVMESEKILDNNKNYIDYETDRYSERPKNQTDLKEVDVNIPEKIIIPKDNNNNSIKEKNNLKIPPSPQHTVYVKQHTPTIDYLDVLAGENTGFSSTSTTPDSSTRKLSNNNTPKASNLLNKSLLKSVNRLDSETMALAAVMYYYFI